MKLNLTTTLLFPAAVSILAQNSLALVPPQGGYGANPYTHQISGQFENTERIVFGPVVGDLFPGAAVHSNGTVYGLLDPAFHNTAFVVKNGVNDLDLVAPIDSDGAAGFAMAYGTQVLLAEVDTDPGANPAIVETLLHTFASNVDMLRAGDVDGDGDDDLICVLGDDVKFLVNSGSSWSHSGNLDFTASDTPLEVVALYWDPSAPTSPYIAVQLDRAVEVWKFVPLAQPPGFALDETFLAAESGGYMCLIPHSDADPVDGLAWTSPIPNTMGQDQVLMVLSQGGMRWVSGNPTPFGETPNSLVAGLRRTSPGDSHVDLLTTTLEDALARVFEYQTPAAPYLAGSPLVWGSAGSSQPTGAGTPAFGDVTGDGVPDALIENEELYFIAGQTPRIGDPEILGFVAGENAWSSPEIIEDGDDARFEITVQLPDNTSGYFTDVQILLWSSDHGQLLNRLVAHNYKYPLAPGPAGPKTFKLLLDGQGNNACGFEEAYFLSLRLIRLIGDDIDDASEGIHGGFAVDPATIANLSNPSGTTEVPIEGQCSAIAQRPGFIPLASLPPIEDNLPPQIIGFEPEP